MALSKLATSLPDLPESPNHPPHTFVFPKHKFRQKQIRRYSCQAVWFKNWKWLHYSDAKDAVFCHVCVKALQSKRMDMKRGEPAFVITGFSNWKDGTVGLKKHEQSSSHKEAVEKMITLPSSCPDVAEMLSREHAEQKKDNRQCLLKILSNLRFLARQGIALRGDGDEKESNFIQLLKLRGNDDPKIEVWLQRKTDKYISHDIQNELLKVMALSILREIAANLSKSSFFSIMADECTDSSNKEQLVICIRWIDDHLDPHEDFIGLYKVDNITADTLVAAIKDVLTCLNLQRCRGQCYDGASTMKGARNGVAKQIADEEPRAIYSHCYGHALNLAAADSVKNSKVLKDALDVTYEVSRLVKFSPKRNAILDKLKETLTPDNPGFRVLCPTRWTVRADSLKSVVDNYAALQVLWEESRDQTADPSIKARIIGVEAQFKTFRYLFGVLLGELLLRHTDNLSKTLQSPKLSAAEGQRIAGMTLSALESLRDDDYFDLFWEKVESTRESLDVDEPQLPRKRKTPRRLEDGNAEAEFPLTAIDYYRQQYYEALDLIVNAIKDRFQQPGYEAYRNLEDLLLKAVKQEDYEECFSFVTTLYKDDIDPSQLRLHLDILKTNFKDGKEKATIFEIKDFILSLSVQERSLMSEVCTVLKLVLVLPATNAISERSFSALRRVKTYLRSTMLQIRLNNLLVLHVHKSHTDSLDLITVANSFVHGSEHRVSVFGRFSESDQVSGGYCFMCKNKLSCSACSK